jgi:hypothetical protein
MALFNWFSKKSDGGANEMHHAGGQHAKPVHSRPAVSAISASGHSRPASDPISRSEERKAKRQMRREQLYSAIRQAMTRAGVLSASYKFKVLSLDQHGNQFLVMIDVLPSLGLHEDMLLENEALVVQIAKTQFNILVTSVYWRIDTRIEPGQRAQADRPCQHRYIPTACACSKQAASCAA